MAMRNRINAIPVSPEERKRAAAFDSTFNPSNAQEMDEAMDRAIPGLKAQYPPLETLPCAKAIVGAYNVCDKPGTEACDNCKLVSYCSAQCQKEHWKTHKQDCKNPMNSEDWLPDWAAQGRQPSFMDSVPGRETISRDDPKYGQSLAVGVSLWGNTPAVDVLNLPKNENDGTKDYSIAFPASGDLRHLVRTVNNLPLDFSGNLTALLNDGNPYVATRNLTILAILAKGEDESLAADIALHYWYSAWMPTEYHFHILHALSHCVREMDEGKNLSLGNHSTLATLLSPSATEILAHSSTAAMSVEQAQSECDRVKHSAHRKDLRDRYYYKLKPSHRVAYQEFRRFGLLLPFGAVNHHFNYPNASLFSVNGKWLQSDFAEPLNGWDVKEVLDAGTRHGCTPEDIYGCLYFYIAEQLRLFVRRLKTLNIAITLFDLEACELAAMLRGQGQATSAFKSVSLSSFDRIALSNITDENYVGLQKSLNAWAPLLSPNSSAIITAYFLNWVFLQHDGRVRDTGKTAIKNATKKYMDKVKLKEKYDHLRSDVSLLAKRTSADLPGMMSAVEAFYDNSAPFNTYLKKRGLQDILNSTKLVLRKKHTIVPHRIGIPLEAPSATLPYLSFPDDESWYNYGVLGSFTWVERFVEFRRA